MATSQRPQQKGASRWNWMQQAVASVESRLDTILGDEEDEPQRKPNPASVVPATIASATPPPLSRNASVKRDSMEASRSGASTPANDRLQARLAQALAKKGANRSESPMPSSEPTSRPVTPAGLADDKTDDPSTTAIVQQPTEEIGDKQARKPLSSSETAVTDTVNTTVDSSRTSIEGGSDKLAASERCSADSIQNDARNITSQLQGDKVQQEMTEEINGYIERIDSLQAKLKYLTTEAASAAKEAAEAVQNGSVEQKLLQKDERIALLLQEGQNLSKTEMKHLQTIKKIRQQYISVNKEHEVTKSRAEKGERSLRIMEDRARRAEAATKRAEQSLTSSLTATNDFDTIRKERDALNTTLADMKAQLSRANARAEAAEGRVETEQLEKERKKNADLQDDLTSVKVERELAEEKLRREVKDLKASVEREKSHARAMETEMLGEQAALESKLESFRARAEEASSSNQGDVQAKLLRQIETLQNQYSAASQNWQGIESSLLARITALEKERDDIASRESDVRRRLREATLKTKKAEREVEEAQSRLPELEKLQIEAEEEANRSTRKVKHLEASLKKAQQDLEEQMIEADKEIKRRVEEEKAKWTAALQTQRLESPGTSLRKGSGLGVELTSSHPSDRPVSRRASYLPGQDSFSPPRQQSLASLKGLSNGAVAEIPSLVTSNDVDEYFANVPPTPASQSHAASPRAVHDLVSTSTVGAGPSVQLVERMSANVRRLESEKAASKDEIARLTGQRDEARQEVVSLMREVEEKRTVDERLKTIEADHKDLTERHKTTLELLGEKSEQVEELEADIVDVKQMYRQLADTMGKT